MLHYSSRLTAAASVLVAALPSLVVALPMEATSQVLPRAFGSSTKPGFPLSDGFPSPSTTQLKAIEERAQGTLPNGALPTGIGSDSITSLQLIAFNEIFEVAFFDSLLYNLTNNVTGYSASDLGGQDRAFVLSNIDAILAQEELHALGANAILGANDQASIVPCDSYSFPVTNYTAAIELANLFTSLVEGTLQDVTNIAADDTDGSLARVIASVIGQEGAQKGWFRSSQGHTPSEQPFLSTAVRDFAFTALQSFITPGTKCANVSDIGLKTFKTLSVVTPPQAVTGKNTTAGFSIDTSDCPNGKLSSGEELYVTYLNALNVPVTVVPAKIDSTQGSTVYFTAHFPYAGYELNGLTIASVSTSSGTYTTADDVVQDAIWGPALIYLYPEGK